MKERALKHRRMEKKKKHKALFGKKRKQDSDDDDNGFDPLGVPTPAELNALHGGKARKKARVGAATKGGGTGANWKDMEIPDYSDAPPFEKCFWEGPLGEDPPSKQLKKLRKKIDTNVWGPLLVRCPPPVEAVSDPSLPKSFGAVFKVTKLSEPTPVQMQCWPAILAGNNVIALAPTGSGKTLGYSLPMIPHIKGRQVNLKKATPVPSPLALVMVPTRELASQVSAAMKPFRRLEGIRSAAIYGGMDKEMMQAELATGGPVHILVATPGRLLDLVAGGRLSLRKVTYLVIDEADRMLALGFAEQLDMISSQLRPDRHTMLFSATFPGKLQEGAKRWLGAESVTVKCSVMNMNSKQETGEGPTEDKADSTPAAPAEDGNTDGDKASDKNAAAGQAAAGEAAAGFSGRLAALTVSKSIKQNVHVCTTHKKPRLLIRYVLRVRAKEKEEKLRQARPMIIFCTKIKTVKFVAQTLRRHNVVLDTLHGQMDQRERERSLNFFKTGKTHTLIATDVAARGLHVNRLAHVVNYDFPPNLEQYCHRVGRTGRQGAEGAAYSLFTKLVGQLAPDLVTLLDASGQQVEPALKEMAARARAGEFARPSADSEEDGEDGDEEGDSDEDADGEEV